MDKGEREDVWEGRVGEKKGETMVKMEYMTE